MKNRIISLLLAVVMIASMVPITAMPVFASTGSAKTTVTGSYGFVQTYADYDTAVKVVATKQLPLSAVLNEYTGGNAVGTQNEETWYIVRSSVTENSRINVSGHVHLIIPDGVTLNAASGICLNGGNTLSVHPQDSYSGGTLIANASEIQYCAGIGGDNDCSGGVLNVYGCTVEANGGQCASGIGGGFYGNGGTFNLYGGAVTAHGGQDGSGIGYGYRAQGGTINLYGGTAAAYGYYADAFTSAPNIHTCPCFYDTVAMYDVTDNDNPKPIDSYDGQRNVFIDARALQTVNKHVLESIFEQATSTDLESGEPIPGWHTCYQCTCGHYFSTYNEETGELSGEIRDLDYWKAHEGKKTNNDYHTLTFENADEVRYVDNGKCLPAEYIPEPDKQEDKLSLGWQYTKDGKTYFFNENVPVTDDMTLKYLEMSTEEMLNSSDKTEITTSDQASLTSLFGIYSVSSSSDIVIDNRCAVCDWAVIILPDGCNITFSKGIDVPERRKLFIITPDGSVGSGRLTANSGEEEAAIGGSHNDGGTVCIYGGTVTANGGRLAAGIGGGDGGDGGTVRIYGGTVTANGGRGAAGIGGGCDGNGGTVRIYGGAVTANGGFDADGIGGGSGGDGDGGTVYISGGTVTAVGGTVNSAGQATGHGKGIGNGYGYEGGTLFITGGVVRAEGSTAFSGDVTLSSNMTAYDIGDSEENAPATTALTSGKKILVKPTPYDYLAVIKGAYIDTGIKPTENTRVVMDVDVKGETEYWFGVWDTDYNRSAFALGNDGSGIYAGYGNQGGTNSMGPLSNGYHTVEMNKHEVYFDGMHYSGIAHHYSAEGFPIQHTLYLFAQNRAGKATADAKQKDIHCYGCEIYEGDTLVREYVPGKNNLGLSGLWDLVNGVFVFEEIKGTTAMTALNDTAEAVSEQKPTCTENGHILYYRRGFNYYSDEECTKKITDLSAWLSATAENGGGMIPAAGHTWQSLDGEKHKCSVCQAEEEHTDSGTGKCSVCGGIAGSAMFDGVSLTLASDIYMNFYMQFVNDEVRTNGKTVFTIGGRTVEGVTAEFNEEKGRYYFTCPLNALEMAETVTAAFTCGGETCTMTYSIPEYLAEILTGTDEAGREYPDELKTLAEKIANYGHFAQIYLASLHSETVTIGEDGYAEMKAGDASTDVTAAQTALASREITVDPPTTGKYALLGRTVYFDSATALNYYITVKDGGTLTADDIVCAEGKSFTVKKTTVMTGEGSVTAFVISVKDINALELDTDFTVTVGKGDDTLKIIGSVFAYCNAVMSKNGQTDAAKDAMAAIYEYYLAAKAYDTASK